MMIMHIYGQIPVVVMTVDMFLSAKIRPCGYMMSDHHTSLVQCDKATTSSSFLLVAGCWLLVVVM
jgi:hypothetical protein